MKKTILIICSTVVFVFGGTSCGTKDNKNEVEHYPTYDTTDKPEQINSAKDTSSHDGMQP